MKKLYQYVRLEFSFKVYFILTIILFIISVIRPIFPVKESYSAYQYRFGIIGSWITYYQPKNYGLKTIWFNITNSNLGFSFSPSVLFWDSLLIYIGYIILVFIIHGFPKHRL